MSEGKVAHIRIHVWFRDKIGFGTSSLCLGYYFHTFSDLFHLFVALHFVISKLSPACLWCALYRSDRDVTGVPLLILLSLQEVGRWPLELEKIPHNKQPSRRGSLKNTTHQSTRHCTNIKLPLKSYSKCWYGGDPRCHSLSMPSSTGYLCKYQRVNTLVLILGADVVVYHLGEPPQTFNTLQNFSTAVRYTGSLKLFKM